MNQQKSESAIIEDGDVKDDAAHTKALEELGLKKRNEHSARVKAIEALALEKYVAELEMHGYTVVPPSVTGFTDGQLDEVVEAVLKESEAMIGCGFTLDGPEFPLDYGNFPGVLELFSGAKPSQFQLFRLSTVSRAFRDLSVNPVAVALVRYMIGPFSTRFSAHNAFIKWAGEGYGESLGMHCDQQGVPLPWGHRAYNANCTWALTDYSFEDGAIACVPGSHRSGNPPGLDAASEAVPIECPKGSLIAFHGGLHHGAYPKKTPGLRLTFVSYFRHSSIMPQDDIANGIPRELADDCIDPETFRDLAGFGYPYQSKHVVPFPKPIRPE